MSTDENKDFPNNTNQIGRKSLVGDLSEKIFFTLSHALNVHANLTVYLLLKKVVMFLQANHSKNQ